MLSIGLALLVLLTASNALIAGSTEGSTLDKFVSHFEPLNYDAKQLMSEHSRLSRSIDGSGYLRLQFAALGRQFNLRLERGTPRLAEGGEVRVDGVPYIEHLKYIYHGVDETDSSARIHGDVVLGVFSGHIRTNNEVYYIEPSSRYKRDLGGHSIIYRSSDVSIPTNNGFCGHGNLAIHSQLASEALKVKQMRRYRRQDSSLTLCELKIIADNTYYGNITEGIVGEDSRKIVVTSLIMGYVDNVASIYEGTDFEGVTGISLAIRILEIETTTNPSFSSVNIGVENFLDIHAQTDHSEFCLAYRFTARDFNDGVLGLAYVGELPGRGAAGGICENHIQISGLGLRSLNTGIVTITNFNRRVARTVVEITFAHEIGHNFGSPHDPDTSDCQPASGGNYIMFAHASSGQMENNDEFSPCSRQVMAQLITGKGQTDCFTENTGSICGNGIVEGVEACDCGQDMDLCCNCNNCTLSSTVQCSPSQGPCCGSDCTFLSSSVTCQPETDCQTNASCNGMNASCPMGTPINQICNNNQSFCVDGECTGSYCLALGLEPCECTETSQLCSVCCTNTMGVCVPTSTLVDQFSNLLPEDGLNTPPGGLCDQNEGYCDFLGNCRQTASEGALGRIAGFGGDALNSVIDWVQDMWWAVLLIAIGILLGLFLIVFLVERLLPKPDHIKAREEKRKQRKEQQRR